MIIMTGLAVFILAIAVFNFINLITARSDKRIIEAGIRKVAGAHKKHIVFQFLGESVLTAFIALALSLLLVEFFLPPFSALLERDLALYDFFGFSMLASLIALAAAVGLMAGLYPAISFASHQPAAILKGQLNPSHKTPILRIFLVVSQFAIVVFLITFLWVVNDQIRFMKHDDLGFDGENVLLFRGITPGIESSYQVLKQDLLQLPEVSAVTASQAVPGAGGSGQFFRLRGQHPSEAIPIIYFATIDDFIDFYDIRLLEGRWLDNVLAGSYRFEERSFRIILHASLVAIIIALLGLYGLSSYMVQSRHREVSTRKVFGASSAQIMMVFFKVILKWVVIGMAVAWPPAYLVADRWLENFAYRINLTPRFFLVSALVTLGIASLTIVYQVFTAARRSPVKSLKA